MFLFFILSDAIPGGHMVHCLHFHLPNNFIFIFYIFIFLTTGLLFAILFFEVILVRLMSASILTTTYYPKYGRSIYLIIYLFRSYSCSTVKRNVCLFFNTKNMKKIEDVLRLKMIWVRFQLAIFLLIK